ncbi:MAG: Vegetative cell wall protein [Frankiales bacterium]|nr:Vegetative cell wall protein [Frankiales bacterium]
MDHPDPDPAARRLNYPTAPAPPDVERTPIPVTTAPAETTATTTEGTEPRPGPAPLTRTQKVLTGTVVTGVIITASLGFIGSYTAVTQLAANKGFGWFANAFPAAVDSSIVALLALDILLAWRRMPYPLLRPTAWFLTAATIAFNAAVAWPDKLGAGMHGVIPVLFVIAIEAARHAVGRIADITADKHYETPPVARWILAPVSTFRLYRRMRVWGLRSYEEALAHQQEIRIYRAQLRRDHGKKWKQKAPADKLLVLELARYGKSIPEAIEMPKAAARKQAEAEALELAEANRRAEAEAEAKHQAELRRAEAEAKRRAEIAEAEAAEAEARHRIEAAEAEAETKRRTETARAEAAEAEVKHEAEAAARLLEAETEAKLADLAREQREAAEAEATRRRNREAEEANRQRIEQIRAQEADEQRQVKRRVEAARERAARAGSEVKSRPETARTASASVSGPASVSVSLPKSAVSVSADLGGRRSKRQTEIDAVLARITEACDSEAVSLKQVMDDFGLKQTTAWDRLSTAQQIWADAQQKTA